MDTINNLHIDNIEESFGKFLTSLNLDITSDGLKDTPRRVAKMFVEETCKGLYGAPPKITIFANEGEYQGPVIITGITVNSLCEHHFQPFIGIAHIAYIPGKHIIGLSKFSRIVDHFARRPQVQERLTSQIFNHLKEVLETENIYIYIKSEHYCMKLRGVSEHKSQTTTQLMGGEFLDPIFAQQHFWNIINNI